MTKIASSHESRMQHALSLARKGEGLTRPNPPVGAVCVSRGKVVGEGYHLRAGGPHAEVIALRAAGKKARGGTLYVTLEPCSTQGRTPACTEAVLASGIKEVVVSVVDPNPLHAGRGLSLLRRKGVRVVKGVCRDEGKALLAPFTKWVTRKKPYLTLKLATTLDGKIADKTGQSQWLTGPEARREVHALRRQVDAIMVGVETVIHDDPQLVPRPAYGRSPFRVVVDTRGRIPLQARLVKDADANRTLLATTPSCSTRTLRAMEKAGVEVLILPKANGRVSLPRLMTALARRNILHILCEGGGGLAEELVRRKLVDAFRFYMAPCLLGGGGSVEAFTGQGWLMNTMPHLDFIHVNPLGRDLVIEARPRKDKR